ncbi:hypothetical protein GCM10009736_18930 [Actinomadura bangladeshensis]
MVLTVSPIAGRDDIVHPRALQNHGAPTRNHTTSLPEPGKRRFRKRDTTHPRRQRNAAATAMERSVLSPGARNRDVTEGARVMPERPESLVPSVLLASRRV